MFPVDLNHYRDQVEAIEAHPVEKGKILLYGNSFFGRWRYDRAHEQLFTATNGKLDILNHGFGGSTGDDLLYYYPRLVTPYEPKAVVIRSVANDIRKGLSPEEAVFLLERLIVGLQTDYPGMPILVITTNDNNHPNPTRMAEVRLGNTLQEELVKKYSGVACIDVNGFFYDDPAHIGDCSKIRDVFGPDNAHLSDAAYEEMSRYLGSRIVKVLEEMGMNL